MAWMSQLCGVASLVLRKVGNVKPQGEEQGGRWEGRRKGELPYHVELGHLILSRV